MSDDEVKECSSARRICEAVSPITKEEEEEEEDLACIRPCK